MNNVLVDGLGDDQLVVAQLILEQDVPSLIGDPAAFVDKIVKANFSTPQQQQSRNLTPTDEVRLITVLFTYIPDMSPSDATVEWIGRTSVITVRLPYPVNSTMLPLPTAILQEQQPVAVKVRLGAQTASAFAHVELGPPADKSKGGDDDLKHALAKVVAFTLAPREFTTFLSNQRQLVATQSLGVAQEREFPENVSFDIPGRTSNIGLRSIVQRLYTGNTENNPVCGIANGALTTGTPRKLISDTHWYKPYALSSQVANQFLEADIRQVLDTLL